MDAGRAVRDLLGRLDAAVSGRSVDDTLALFDPDADVVLLGSEAGESAYGWRELVAFFGHLSARPIGFRWEWDRVEASARGDVVWFVADGSVVETVGDGPRRLPYRFTGVALAGDEGLRLALLHGSEPVPPK